jgi:hypothetical protein
LWIPGLIDPADPFERQLAALAPEEVIKAWFDALGRGDDYMISRAESSTIFQWPE